MVSELFSFSLVCVVLFSSALHHIEYLMWHFMWAWAPIPMQS